VWYSLKGWLGADRMSEILNSEIFYCHKTTSATLEKGKETSAFFKVNVNVELFVVKANIFNKPRRIYTECLGE
jgi:hypothetical protein